MNLEEQLQQAYQFIKAEQRKEAIALLKEILQSSPKADAAWFLLGHALTDPEEKRNAFEKALALNPNNENAQQALDKLNRPLKTSQKSDPLSNGAIFFLGTLAAIMLLGIASAAVWVFFVRGNGITVSDAQLDSTARAAGTLEETSNENNGQLPATWTPTPYIEPTLTLTHTRTPVPSATLTPAPLFSATPDGYIDPHAGGGGGGSEGGTFGDAMAQMFEDMFSVFFDIDPDTVSALETGLTQAQDIDEVGEYYGMLFLVSLFNYSDESEREATLARQTDLMVDKFNALYPSFASPADYAKGYRFLLLSQSFSMDLEAMTTTAVLAQDELGYYLDNDALVTIEDQITVYSALSYAATVLGDEAATDAYIAKLQQDIPAQWHSLTTIEDLVHAYYFILGDNASSVDMDIYSDELDAAFYPENIAYTQTLNAKLLDLVQTETDPEALALAYRTLGAISDAKGNAALALSYYKLLLTVDDSAETLLDLSSAYSATGNEGCAYVYSQSALESDDPFILIWGKFIEAAMLSIKDSYAGGEIPACADF